MDKAACGEVKQEALAIIAKAGIVLTEAEKENAEVADFGLGDLRNFGLQIIVYVNNSSYCAKEMALLPGQVCPEHMHAPIPSENYSGKRETFRCRYGSVELFADGIPESESDAVGIMPGSGVFTVSKRILLQPGKQYTIEPGVRHWFRARPDGAVISEFSTPSRDDMDIFTDSRIVRLPANANE